MARREKGEGSLYQAKDKTWVYQYSVDGKRRTKRFRRKADAKAFMAALSVNQTEISIEKPTAGSQKAEPITVGEWMDRWLEKYAKPTVKLSTYCSYEQLIRSHIKPQIGGCYMSTLTSEDLQDFFNERRAQGNLKREGGLSTKTLTNLRNMMHLVFGQAVKNKLLSENLVEGVRLPKAEKQEMRVLDREEQTRLILAARRAPEPAAFGIIFDLFTGLRMGELCGLRWENVDMEGRSFKVCETRNRLRNFDDSVETSTSVETVKSTKTDNSRRTVFIMDGDKREHINRGLEHKQVSAAAGPVEGVAEIAALHGHAEGLALAVGAALVGVVRFAALVLANEDGIVVASVLVEKAQPDEGGDHLPVQVAVFEQIGEHAPVVCVSGREGESFLLLLPWRVHLGAELTDVLAQQGENGFLIVHAVELLEEGHRPAAFLGSVVIPLVAPDGDAVVALQPQLPPGADEGLPLEAEELGQVHRVGLTLLFFCEMDVGHCFSPRCCFFRKISYNFRINILDGGWCNE